MGQAHAAPPARRGGRQRTGVSRGRVGSGPHGGTPPAGRRGDGEAPTVVHRPRNRRCAGGRPFGRRVGTGVRLEPRTPRRRAGIHVRTDAAWRRDSRAEAPFVSVETVSTGEERHHVAVFDKLPLAFGFAETGDIGLTRRSRDEVVEIVATVDAALSALEVRDRVTHTEVAVTTSGPQVIEVNGRLGGYVQGMCQVLEPGLDMAALASTSPWGTGRRRPRSPLRRLPAPSRSRWGPTRRTSCGGHSQCCAPSPASGRSGCRHRPRAAAVRRRMVVRPLPA